METIALTVNNKNPRAINWFPMFKFFRTSIACLMCLFASGCLVTTASLMNDTWAKWEGRDVDLFFDRFGQAESVEKTVQGSNSYRWVGVGDSMTVFGTSYGHPVSLYCVLTIEVIGGRISSMRMAKTEGEWNWPRCNQILNSESSFERM